MTWITFVNNPCPVKKYNMYKSLDAAAKFDGSLHDAPFSEHSFISLSIKYVIEVKMRCLVSFLFIAIAFIWHSFIFIIEIWMRLEVVWAVDLVMWNGSETKFRVKKYQDVIEVKMRCLVSFLFYCIHLTQFHFVIEIWMRLEVEGAADLVMWNGSETKFRVKKMQIKRFN